MQSPLKDLRFKNAAIKTLKNIIPKNAVVDSYGLFAGTTELSLSSVERTVRAHTEQDVVFQFWSCLIVDPARMCSILGDPAFKFYGEAEFVILQENLPLYRDAFVRSSLFFLLNRCSETGQISCGKFNVENYTAHSVNQIRRFIRPKQFSVHKQQNAIFPIEKSKVDGEYVLFPTLKFSYNLFESGRSRSYDSHAVNHQRLKKAMSNTSRKVILVYKYDPRVETFYKDFQKRYVDNYGLPTNNSENCEEIIVTNF
tara:strand:- start:574 stop:1338 length:765 start_codon:yes stop_codon:yes gene_type:complete